jgi:hypothetical protein
MAVNINIDSQIVTQTISEWAIDTTTYVTNTLLFVSDSTYLFTNQQKFKKADGVNTFANLDFMPIDDYYVNSFKTRVDAHGGVTEALDCLDTQLEALDVTPAIMLTPNGVKDGKLLSIIGNTSQTDMDWSGGAGTRINKDLFIEDSAINVPRINYPIGGGCPSVLLEPQRTNLITYSNDFSNASWLKIRSTLSLNKVISPSGDIDAFELIENVGLNTHYIRRPYTFGTLGNNIYSVYAKANTRDIICLGFNGYGNNAYSAAYFDLTNGIVANEFNNPNAKIEDIGNGWYKCSVQNNELALLNAYVDVFISDNIYTGHYNGNGSSSVYIYQAQLEQGSFVTSPITTQGATVTRLKDAGTNCGTVDDFNSEEGVLFVEMKALANDLSNRIISISDNTNTNQVAMFYTTIDNSVRANYTVAGVKSFDFTFALADITQFNKITIRWKENDFSLWVNGIKVLEDLLGSVASPNTFKELKTTQGDNSLPFEGQIKKLHVYKQALTDAQIQAL